MRLFVQLIGTLICLLLFFESTSGFANMLLKDCEKAMSLGIDMMGTPLESSYDRVIEVINLENNGAVANGSTISVSDEKSLLVKIQPPTQQCALEVRGAGSSFPRGGKCDAKRMLCGNRNGALLELSSEGISGAADIEIVAAWAVSFKDGVKLSAPFTIHAEELQGGEL